MALVHLSKPPSQRQEPHFYHNLPCLCYRGAGANCNCKAVRCKNPRDPLHNLRSGMATTHTLLGVRTSAESLLMQIRPNITCLIMPGWNLEQMAQPVQAGGVGGPRKLPMEAGNEKLTNSISNGRVDRPGFGGLQADVPKCHRCVTLVQFMDCQLMAGADLWRAKLPKVAAEGGIGPPPPSLAASVAAPLEDNYTLRAAKVRSRSRDGSSVGDALTHLGCMNLRLHMTFTQFFIF
ncbi:hypothetical protein PCASD_04657 [Puccinia coronata f. sp. avenae]|uniref:Uncharacterized protein n=1 Tax=Puccinia coronata f. sp. avenae TaxID=200324 RepID=A0A2N5UXJ4_9BASI|nr:hypothetical protein PCASD_04657 [Puccinia coronata f. sp. avenae]